MNIESISYRSIVNRYMHNDRTLIFSRIATLHLGFSDSSRVATAPSTHIHNPNPLNGVLTIPCLENAKRFSSKYPGHWPDRNTLIEQSFTLI